MAPNDTLTHPGYNVASHVEQTLVYFDPTVTDELIESYVNVRSPVQSDRFWGG